MEDQTALAKRVLDKMAESPEMKALEELFFEARENELLFGDPLPTHEEILAELRRRCPGSELLAGLAQHGGK